jgi:2-oxoglutarate dehydrogenase E1 component
MDQDPGTPAHAPSFSSELNKGTVASFGGKEAHHLKRSDLLLMNEIADPAAATAGQRFSCDDYIKYATTWIRRHYEQNYNLSVCNTTTPAQYFHVLRRQVHRPFVKPLVLCTGKWLQHHAACTSRLEDMGPGTWFRRIISEKSRANNLQNQKRTSFEIAPRDEIERIIICSGKVFYELYHARSHQARAGETERARQNARKITLVRLEQLAPFPMDRVASAVNNFPLAEVMWVQEEPKNQGAWSFVQPRFKTAMSAYYRGPAGAPPPEISYVGRPVSATTAGGSFRDHVKEQREVVRRALDLHT